MKNLTKI